MAFVPVIVVIIFAIAFTPSSPQRGRRRRRRSKGILATMFAAQARTERKNSSHRGVMCGPGGVGARGGRKRK